MVSVSLSRARFAASDVVATLVVAIDYPRVRFPAGQRARLVQSAERTTLNRVVVGSSPTSSDSR